MHYPITVVIVLVGILALSGVASAAEQAAGAGGGGGLLGPFYVLAAGIGMAIASGLCALGQGKAIAGAVDAMARQPSLAGRIQTAMIIGLALIESLALYMFVIAAILLFVAPIKPM